VPRGSRNGYFSLNSCFGQKRDFDSSLKPTKTAQSENVNHPTEQAHFEVQYDLSTKEICRELQKLRFMPEMAFSVFSRLFSPSFCVLKIGYNFIDPNLKFSSRPFEFMVPMPCSSEIREQNVEFGIRRCYKNVIWR